MANEAPSDREQGVAAMIGAQFDQLVSEARTAYGAAVSSCAASLADALRQRPEADLKSALFRSAAASGWGGRLSPPQQRQQMAYAVRQALPPVLAGLDAALALLRGALEPRVYVAVGRALWDLSGRDLFQFVQVIVPSVSKM